MSGPLRVEVRGAAAHGSVDLVGPVTTHNVQALGRTLQAASVMYSEITLDLSHAQQIDPAVLMDLDVLRRRLATRKRRLTIVGLHPVASSARNVCGGQRKESA